MFNILNVDVITEELKFNNNQLPLGQFEISPEISRKTGKVSNFDNRYYTLLTVRIDNTEEHPMPVDIEVTLRAVFTIKKNDGFEEKYIERFLRHQGVHILYPYVRTSINALTGVASMPPITLPIINAFDLFKEDKTWIEENF